jgi:hypothetical protein
MTVVRAVTLAVVVASGCGGGPGSIGTDGGADGGRDGPVTYRPDAGDARDAGDAAPAGDAGGDGGAPGCGAIVTFADGLVPSAEIHVATTGNDLTGTGSAGAPYRTLDRAATDATPGTAIRVHAGTYPGGAYVEGLAGTATAPIWIGGAPGEARPILEGGSEGLHLVRVRYLVVHDLEVRNTAQNGINCDDGGDYANPDATRFVVFRGLSIHGVGATGNEDALKLSGLDDYWVLDSDFADWGTGGGSGIDHVGCHRGLIARNRFTAPGDNAVQTKGGSQDIEVRWNHITLAGGQRAVNLGGSTGLQYFRPPLSTTQPNAEARDIRVIANVIVGGYAALAFVGCVDCLAAHNTIIDPEHWILRILQETTTGGGYEVLPCGGGRVVNNLVYFARGDLATWVNIGADTAPATFTFANNLWYAHDTPGASSPATDLPVTESAPVVGQDPQLRDPGAGDYSIPTGSPAAAAGATTAGVAGDITGACYGSPPSIGAYQARP